MKAFHIACITLVGIAQFHTARGQEYFNPQPALTWEAFAGTSESGQYITRLSGGRIVVLTALSYSGGSRLICYDETNGSQLWDTILATSGGPNGLSLLTDTAVVAMITTSDTLELWSYNMNGILNWHEEYPDLGQATGSGLLKVVAANNIVVAAQIEGMGGYEDILVLKTSSSGQEVWHQVFNGPANRDEQALAIHVDSNQNIVIGGYIWNNAADVQDHLVVKYDANGNWQWTWETEISDFDRICSITSNSLGDIFFSGYVNTGGFIGKLSPSGSLQWSDIYTGTGALDPYNNYAPILMNTDGNLLIIWDFTSPKLVNYSQDGIIQWSSGSVSMPRDLQVRSDGIIIQCGKRLNKVFIQATRPNGVRLWHYPDGWSGAGNPSSGTWRSTILPDGDMITTGSSSNNKVYTLRICLPNVLRCMSEPVSRSVPPGHQMIAGHFNDDAFTDLLVRGFNDPMTVSLGTANGDFTLGGSINSDVEWPNMEAYRSGVGNLDGVLRFFHDPNINPSQIQWFIPNGDGTFEEQPVWDFGQVYRRIRIADIDNDGDDDMALSLWANGNVKVQFMRNNGAGNFVPDSAIAVSNGLMDFALADMNNDGNVDLICMNATTVAIYPGQGSGDFGVPVIEQIPSGNIINAGDIDLDGLPDLIISTTSLLHTWMNTGTTFEPGPVYPTLWGQFMYDVRTNPLGDDGTIPFVLDHFPWYCYFNDSCSGDAIHLGPLTGGPTVLADLNNDGLVDLGVNNGLNSSGMRCYYNCGPANSDSTGTVHVARPHQATRKCPKMSLSRETLINFHWSGPAEPIDRVEVLNIQGIRTSAEWSSGTDQLNLSGLASGMYIVRVTMPKHSCANRIVKL